VPIGVPGGAPEGGGMAKIRWTGEGASSEGSRERGFVIERGGDSIPGVCWFPESDAGPRPLVLMGHGGSGHKRNERMVELGTMFAGDYGWCAASIDGPEHGDRGPIRDASEPEYAAIWQRDDIVASMIEDWRATLDALSQLPEVDSARIGYWGLSMGTLFGLPYVASDERIVAAVLGKAGMTGSSAVRARIAPHFERFAPRVEVPVLFSIQWDDERFDRDGQLDLFDRIGSEDKRLHAYPGVHIDNGPEAFDVQAEFLERYL
jgi:dienelactone hydrolase